MPPILSIRRAGSRRLALPGLLLVGLAAAWLLAASSVHAGSEAPPGASPQAASGDPLGRETPRSAMRGYLTASRDGDYARAAQYLNLRALPREKRQSEGPTLARRLKVVLDRTLWVDLEALSDEPEGNLEDGLPPHRERIGSIETRKGPVDILLDRVRAEGGGRLWKISSATVARIPALYEEFGYGPLGDWLPSPFFEIRLLEIELWQWIGILVAVVLAWSLSWLVVSAGLRVVRRLVARTTTTLDDRAVDIVVGPLRLLMGVLLFGVAVLPLGLAVPAQRFFTTLEKVLAFLAFVWLLFRAVDVFSQWAADRLAARGQVGVSAMLPVGRRIVKVILGGLAAIALLQNIGINVTGLLAGLGVGGLAVALAAQKTVENMFGGITVIADQPVRVGDFCRFGDKVGTVEDIGLRSTRVRTLERTVVSVPNADFSQMQLENFSKRDRFWYHPRIGLRYETTPDQLRYTLVEVRKLLYAHPRVDPDPARIRFVGFGAFSLDLDIFAYVHAADYGEFLEVAEDLNLRIMDIVERAGTSFAFPSQTLYLERGEGLDPERARSVEAEVEAWRRENRLYLPKFPPDEIERLRGTVDYPPEGSALRASS